jgi:hypothetical protein
MPVLCERCQKERWLTILSVMNEELICAHCVEQEKKHPMYKEAKRKMELEAWKGNHDYPGLFSGQKYPFSISA